MNLELPGYRCRGFDNFRVPDHRDVGGIFRHQRQHRHQVRLAGPVVADNQYAFVIDGFVKRQLRDQLFSNSFSHVIGNDIGADQLLRLVGPIGVEKLNHGLDRLKLNEVAIVHRHPDSPSQ